MQVDKRPEKESYRQIFGPESFFFKLKPISGQMGKSSIAFHRRAVVSYAMNTSKASAVTKHLGCQKAHGINVVPGLSPILP